MHELSRRSFLGGAAAACAAAGCRSILRDPPRHRSEYAGVRIGAITYSFAQMPAFPRGCTKAFILGAQLGSVELMDRDFERDIGVVHRQIPAGKLTARQKAEISRWREAARMDALEAYRRELAEAGIGVHIVKFGDLGCPWMYSWKEAEYMFKATRALGARVITREVPKPEEWAAFKETARRLHVLARAYDVDIAFHNHAQIAATTYDGALLDYSPYFKINFDIGNYVAANADDPCAFVKRYAERLASIHIKDRRRNDGPELPFGTGDTPLVRLFETLKAERLDVPCDIELEYPIPRGSDAVRETLACNLWCKEKLMKL